MHQRRTTSFCPTACFQGLFQLFSISIAENFDHPGFGALLYCVVAILYSILYYILLITKPLELQDTAARSLPVLQSGQ